LRIPASQWAAVRAAPVAGAISDRIDHSVDQEIARHSPEPILVDRIVSI
jgi:hypothetical protein